MSLVYSDTTNKRGIIQTIEEKVYKDYGAITGDTNNFLRWTNKINLAKDRMLALALQASGTWQIDDTNQTDYPIIKANIVSGQRDYPFTTDASGNLILEVEKVLILPTATSTIYQQIYPIDQQSEDTGIDTEDGSVGVPYQYDKTANALFLDPTPNYNATNGIKMFISRETLYYTTADTTKKSGFPGIFDEYLALRPVYEHACENSLANEVSLRDKVLLMEQSITNYFSKRERDVQSILSGSDIIYE